MRTLTVTCICLLLLLGIIGGCSDGKSPAESDVTLAKLTCVECHTDEAKLMELAKEEPVSEGEAGEG